MTRPGKTIGYFRAVVTPEATRRALDTHGKTYFRSSDERCRYEVKRHHILQPCGNDASRCVDGVWYCKRHADRIVARARI